MDSNQEHPLYPPDAEPLPGAIDVVETGRRGKVRYWIETCFSVMVRSLGLHRIDPFPSRKHLVALPARVWWPG